MSTLPPAPTRPDPGVPERAPDLEYERRGSWLLAIAGVLLVVVLCIAFGIALSQPKPKDTRELRRYGDLECVYNVTRDKVEACR